MDATLTKTGSRYALAIERHLAHPQEKVWRALTERDLLSQWFPADITGGWDEGAALEFVFLHGEGEGLPEEELRGEVLVADPPRLLEFRWGGGVIRCELVADGDGCRLLFSETLADPSMGARNAAGWELCLENLELLLEGASVAKFVWDVWRTKFQHYVKKFRPEHGPQQEPPASARPSE